MKAKLKRPPAQLSGRFYRLAVPMSEETLEIVDLFCERWDCTRTEAARWLLKSAALQYAAGELVPA